MRHVIGTLFLGVSGIRRRLHRRIRIAVDEPIQKGAKVRFRLLMLANAAVLGVSGIPALWIPTQVMSALGLEPALSSTPYVRLIGALLLEGSLLCWLVSDAAEYEQRGPLFLALAIGWSVSFGVLLEAAVPLAAGVLAWIGAAVSGVLSIAHWLSWRSLRGKAWRVGRTMSNRELLAWLIVIVAVFTFLFSIYQPMIWRSAFGERPPTYISSLAGSVELIVGLFSIGIVVVGATLLKLIGDQVNREVEESATVHSYHANAAAMSDLGLSYWLIYTDNQKSLEFDHKPPESKLVYLSQAIGVTQRALNRFCVRLDMNNRTHEATVLMIQNNYIYYVAERHLKWSEEAEDSQSDLAEFRHTLRLAKHLEKRLIDYPNYAKDWEDTIEYAREVKLRAPAWHSKQVSP